MSSAIKFASTMALLCALVSAPAFGQKNLKGAVCPLSDSQTQKSIEAFAKLADFMTHEPRCVNCHGGVNPHIDGIGKDPKDKDAPPSLVEHGGGKQPREYFTNSEGKKESHIPVGCKECHNKMAPKRDGTESRWMTAPFVVAFVGRDAKTICQQIRRQSDDAKDFIGHLIDDNGGNNFGGTAFNGDRGLDRGMYPESEVPTKKPSISHEALIKMGQDWVDAQGGEFKGDETCGCVPAHYAIRVTNTFEYRSGRPRVPVLKSNSKTDIPITFADDGSFTGQATVNVQADLSGVCQGQSTADRSMVKASGNAIETPEKHAMHIQLVGSSSGTVNATVTCPGGGFGFESIPNQMTGQPLPPFELKGQVGEAVDRPLVIPFPGFTSNLHLQIVKREP